MNFFRKSVARSDATLALVADDVVNNGKRRFTRVGLLFFGPLFFVFTNLSEYWRHGGHFTAMSLLLSFAISEFAGFIWSWVFWMLYRGIGKAGQPPSRQ